ncbi:MAG: D-alanyl-D-alanine carboxypeptidase family protein, partial [Oscillospiraceae bacterium]|nr:D-alanyl-D-alanine carboxypeptidase family protein [Oscillospiraceae bacterium]
MNKRNLLIASGAMLIVLFLATSSAALLWVADGGQISVNIKPKDAPIVQTPTPEPTPMVQTPMVQTPTPEAIDAPTPMVQTPTPTPAPIIQPPLSVSPGFTLPDTDEYDNEWAFFLINKENPLPEDYTVPLRRIYGNFEADARIADYAILMMSDARSEGYNLSVVSANRTLARQRENFEARVSDLMARGFSEENARELTEREIALPGNSEHNAGLAIDFARQGEGYLTFENTPEFKWISQNSWRYGFILRYPKDKHHITGIIYEPWHYRFV